MGLNKIVNDLGLSDVSAPIDHRSQAASDAANNWLEMIVFNYVNLEKPYRKKKMFKISMYEKFLILQSTLCIKIYNKIHII